MVLRSAFFCGRWHLLRGSKPELLILYSKNRLPFNLFLNFLDYPIVFLTQIDVAFFE